MRISRFVLLAALAAEQTGFAFSKFLSSPRDLVRSEYDFIIVGAGTAGSVLANRLTEDPRINVLVVEAGISNANILNLSVPFLSVNLPGTLVDWNYTTTPQIGLNNRTIPVPRGYVLGGSSSINRLIWNRGSNDVWDNWAKLTNDPGWSWNAVEPFYLKTFHNVAPSLNTTPPGHGPVQVSLPGYVAELDSLILNGSKSLGGRFGFTKDLNTGKMLGFSSLAASIGNGTRSSSATAYLETAVDRSNLDVTITTHVTKLISKGKTKEGLPIFSSIEMAQASDPQTLFQAHATKEIIISGGVIGSPQLLLLSGIGPKQDLRALNINTIVDNQDVGHHLADHPLIFEYFEIQSNDTFDDVLRNRTVFQEQLNEWLASRQGLFVDSFASTLGFTRLLPNSSALQSVTGKNPASGPLSANTEMLFLHGFGPFLTNTVPPTGNYMTVVTVLVSPTSRGTITLKSTNPFDHPNVNTGFLTSDFDIQAMLDSVKDTQTFIKAALPSGFILRQIDGLANAPTDQLKIEVIRNNAVTTQHPVGTNRMSPKHASWGVTDPDLRVKGTSGLRVVDASVFPQIPECHPQSLVYTVAERISQLIKQTHGIA